MEIQIIDATGTAPQHVRELVRDRISRQFARLRVQIRRVTARLTDVNGPRGGADKDVSLEVAWASGGRLRLAARTASYVSALSRALRTAKRLVAEQGRAVRARRRRERVA